MWGLKLYRLLLKMALEVTGHFKGACVRPKRDGAPEPDSRPPLSNTLCAGARAFARHGTPEGDSLLVWYRSHGREQANAVEMYLARRALVSCWPLDAERASAVIRWAMTHVLAGRCRTEPLPIRLRDEMAQALRAQAAAWLRAGIMEAQWRYGLARG
ncbi:hypothetical protein GCM10027193_16540 [Arenimonas aestuarii]